MNGDPFFLQSYETHSKTLKEIKPKTDSLIVDFQASRLVDKEVRGSRVLELFVHELVFYGLGVWRGGKIGSLMFLF